MKFMNMTELQALPHKSQIESLLEDTITALKAGALGSASWRLADASFLLRRRMELQGYTNAQGFDEVTGRDALMGGTAEQLKDTPCTQ